MDKESNNGLEKPMEWGLRLINRVVSKHMKRTNKSEMAAQLNQPITFPRDNQCLLLLKAVVIFRFVQEHAFSCTPLW